MGAHIEGYTWRPKIDIRYVPGWLSTLYVEMCVSHLNPELTSTASLSTHLTLGIPCLSTPGITNRLPDTPCMCVGAGDLDSDPRTYAASSFLTEPPHLPSPGDNFLSGFFLVHSVCCHSWVFKCSQNFTSCENAVPQVKSRACGVSLLRTHQQYKESDFKLILTVI